MTIKSQKKYYNWILIFPIKLSYRNIIIVFTLELSIIVFVNISKYILIFLCWLVLPTTSYIRRQPLISEVSIREFGRAIVTNFLNHYYYQSFGIAKLTTITHTKIFNISSVGYTKILIGYDMIIFITNWYQANFIFNRTTNTFSSNMF